MLLKVGIERSQCESVFEKDRRACMIPPLV
jgi:hypothetical protein